MNRVYLRVVIAVFLLTAGLALTVQSDISLATDLTSAEQAQALAHIDSLFTIWQPDSIYAYLEPLLLEARSADDSSFVLPLVVNFGRFWVSVGQPQRSESLLLEATALAEALPDSEQWCNAVWWLAVGAENQGKMPEARTWYEKLSELAAARNDRCREAWALVGLAYQEGLGGLFNESIRVYQRAVELFRGLEDQQGEAWTLNGLGTSLQNTGRYAEALTAYQQTAELAGQVGDRNVESMARNNLGSLEFDLGDPGVALDHFQQANHMQRELGQHLNAITSGSNIALCFNHLGRLDDAAELLTTLHGECEERGFQHQEPMVLGHLAIARRLQGSFREAAAIYRRIFAMDETVVNLKTRAESVIGLAEALAAMDSNGAALTVMQDGDRRWGQLLQGVVKFDYDLVFGRCLLTENQPQLALLKLQPVTAAARRDSLSGYLVFGLVGEARCFRALDQPDSALVRIREAAQVWESMRRAPLDPEWRERRSEIGELIFTQLAALLLTRSAGRATPQQITQAFDAVQIFKARTLAERIEAGSGGEPTEAPSTDLVTLERLQQEVLRSGELFLDVYLGPEESVLFLVTRERCQAILLPSADELEPRLRLFHELMATSPTDTDTSPAEAALHQSGDQLLQLLLGEETSALANSSSVIVCPDGALNLIPWPALAAELTSLGSNHSATEWTRIPSATILAGLRAGGRSGETTGNGMLAAAGKKTEAGLSMPGAEAEVREIHQRYRDVDLHLGSGDEPSLQPTDLAGYAILHLASHARVDDQRPWFSAIVLNPDVPDGSLRADRIAEMNLSADLAVLSACATGGGGIVSGEGVLGLSTAFLSAGVSAVVASLWPVADDATTQLMEYFYQELATGQNVAQALDGARTLVRSQPETAHPFYWAGFVLIGDGTVELSLVERNRNWLPWAGLFVAVILLSSFWYRPLRRRQQS